MLSGSSVRHIATAIHSHHTTKALLAALQETLSGIGGSGAYTMLFTAADGSSAEVCGSTLVALKPGRVLTAPPDMLVSSLQRTAPTYFATLQTMTCGDDELQVAMIAPLRADGESYGALILHEVVPEGERDLVEFTAEQLGLALLHVQLNEELQRRHAIDAAKLSVIAETGNVLRELEIDVVLAKLMELALSTVAAEVGCIALRETSNAELTCRVEWGLDGSALEQLCLIEGERLGETVVNENRPFIVRNMVVENPFLPATILSGIDSLAAIPLTTHERVLGCLIVINLSASSEQDIELLRTIVELSSTTIENAVLHQQALEKEALREQLRIAGDIQRGLLPTSAPTMKGVQISAWNIPCDESGGDYYDFFRIDEHRIGFVVGDATGHGIGAALMATTARALLRALVGFTDDLAELFGRLNNLAEVDFTDSKFITLFFGIYDTRDLTLTYVSAGHCPPLIIYRHTQDAFEYLKSTGIPLGIFPDVPYEQKTAEPLEAGDLMLLLTDGMEEAPSETGERFGQERLLSLIRLHHDAAPADLIEIIYRTVSDFCGVVPQKDDITLLCLRATEN
jgi:serine phosphatase RsbU (regulator of sigma subunit)